MTAALRIVLPRASALTAVLMSDPGPAVRTEEISLVRSRLDAKLRMSRSQRRSRPIRVDSYRMQLALGSPQRLDHLRVPFEPSPASSKRSIGIAAVASCVGDPSLAPAAAVDRVLGSVTNEVAPGGFAWWAGWYRSLPRAARFVVQAEATTWATQLYESLEWWRFERQVRVGADLRWMDCRSDTDVRAKVDVAVVAGGSPAFFVMQTGIAGPQWSAALALPALVAAMARGEEAVPSRVVGFWPASGQVRILPIEPGSLDRASRFLVDSTRVLRRFAL
jgi:hypothetical protein